jgi:hypothetical protein
MQAVRVRAGVEEGLMAIVPAHAVVDYATPIQHLQDLTHLGQIAEVRTIDHDLISNLRLHNSFLPINSFVLEAVRAASRTIRRSEIGAGRRR